MRLNTGPSALALPLLTASELCSMFHRKGASHRECHEMKVDLLRTVLSALSFRKTEDKNHLEAVLASGGSDQISTSV